MRIEGVEKSFKMGDETINVLRGIDLEIKKGEIVSITGPSGSGKSTLLHIAGGLDFPDKGSVKVESEELTALKDERLSKIRNEKIGFVFQFHHLLPEFTILENVMIPLLVRGESFQGARIKAGKVLSEVGLSERIHHKPSQISGGERQRAAVARAIVGEPAIILADEPTGNLDKRTEKELIKLLLFLNKKGATFLIVTHNPEVADMAHRIFKLREGKLVKRRK